MKSSQTIKARRPYFMAVVLGTALAAMGTDESLAASEISPRAITHISRYCTACWRNARLPQDRWNDCTQEVLCRLLKSLPAKAWEQALAQETEERREFIRAIDAVKKRCQRNRLQSVPMPELIADERAQVERQANEERTAVRQAAAALLSVRQQHILQMIGEGYNVADIASELALPPERISDEKYKAIRKLRSYFSVDQAS